MDTLVLLSRQLADLPALTQVAAVLCTTDSGCDGLVIRYPNGTDELVHAPAGSRRWLLRLFTRHSGQVIPAYDADFKVYTFHVSVFQSSLKTWADSRELCARVSGVVR